MMKNIITGLLLLCSVVPVMYESKPAQAANYIDTVNYFAGGSGFGVYNQGSTYVGATGGGVFDARAVTDLDGAILALGGASGTPGSIVVSFSYGSVVDGVGADFRLFDTFGLSEGFDLEASTNGTSWVNLGHFSTSLTPVSPSSPGITSVDLAGSGLSQASFFKITADTPSVYSYPEAYDLDTLEALNFTSSTAPVPEPGTIALFGLGIAGLAVYGKRRQKKA